MLRVGFIGCGRISDLHIGGYEGRSDARVTALCDTNRELAVRRAEKWGLGSVATFDDYRDLCESGAVDLVEIIVPHHLHYEIAAFAIGCDLHVSLQKPLSLNLDDADRLVEMAAASPRVTRVYENFIHYPPVVAAVELIEAGVIGEPLSVRLKSNSGYSPQSWPIPAGAQRWRQDPAQCGGGPLTFDDGHHKFALAWLMLGQPEQVHAWIGSTRVEPRGVLDSPTIVSMRYPGAEVGSIEVVHSPGLLIERTEHYAQDDRLEVTGTRGVIWVNRGHGQIGDAPPLVSYTDGRVESYDCPSGWELSFVGATRALLDDMAAGRTPVLTFEQARDVLAASLAAQRSSAEGNRVDVDAPIGASHRHVRTRLSHAAASGAGAVPA